MMNPYGPCYHTKYVGCAPCVHSAWDEGYEIALERVESAAEAVEPILKSTILDIVWSLYNEFHGFHGSGMKALSKTEERHYAELADMAERGELRPVGRAKRGPEAAAEGQRLLMGGPSGVQGK